MNGSPAYDSSLLENAVIELTDPAGKVYRFRYEATIPYAAADYIMLSELDAQPGQEMVLVTRLHEEEGSLSFSVVEEEDIIDSVLEKYTARRIGLMLDDEESQRE